MYIKAHYIQYSSGPMYHRCHSSSIATSCTRVVEALLSKFKATTEASRHFEIEGMALINGMRTYKLLFGRNKENPKERHNGCAEGLTPL